MVSALECSSTAAVQTMPPRRPTRTSAAAAALILCNVDAYVAMFFDESRLGYDDQESTVPVRSPYLSAKGFDVHRRALHKQVQVAPVRGENDHGFRQAQRRRRDDRVHGYRA